MMGAITYLSDRLQNLVSGLGTGRDKAAGVYFSAPLLTEDQINNAYRGNWLARRIVDVPALDATRKWRAWQAEAGQISALEAEEKRLNIREKVLQALTLARLHGGAALMIGTGEANPALPINVDAIGQGGLRYVAVVPRRRLSAGVLDWDPASERFGLPVDYTLNTGRGQGVRIHPSRLVSFIGSPMPDAEFSSDGWGESVLTSAMQAIQDAAGTSSNVASLIYEAKIDVIKIPRLMESLASGDPDVESKLLQRFALAATAKGINGTLILDAEEEYDQKTASFGTLPEIMDRFFQCVSGASGIPVSRLMGISAAGMNATGDGDERVYYDSIQAMQELEMSPAMSILDEAIIRSALGNRPEEVHYNWIPLRQKTEREIAEIGKLTAEIGAILVNAGLAPSDAISKSVSNALTESGAMPGLEAAIEEFPPEEEDPDEARAILMPRPVEQPEE